MIILNIISVTSAITTFVAYFIYKLKKKQESKLGEAIVVAFTAGYIPKFFVLIMASYNPNLLSQVEGRHLILAIAGLVCIRVSIKTIYEKFSSSSP